MAFTSPFLILAAKFTERSRAMSSTTFFLLLLLAAHLPFSWPKTHPDDIKALRQLKASVNPSSIPGSSCLSSWYFSPNVDPCDSLFSATHFTCGLRCDDVSPTTGLARVTDISLDPAGYSGRLPASLWSLPSLRTLYIPDNRLYGAIPPPPSSATQLRRLSLSRNLLSGPLPDLNQLPALEELLLDGNRLSGSLPSALPTLPNLKRLELQLNNLTGELPGNMHAALPTLYYLDLSDNEISGGLPASLPPSVVEIAARGNRLEGPLPEAFGSLPYLQVVDLSHNYLTGKVPGSFFCHPSLEQLVLAGNRLSSLESPAWLMWSVSQLVALDVSGNEVAGTLPAWLAALPRLSALSLERNRISGMIPWAFAAREFSRLLLAGNYLCGPIPSPLTAAREASGLVSLANNCFMRCPEVFPFCQGGRQKAEEQCRAFNPFIP